VAWPVAEYMEARRTVKTPDILPPKNNFGLDRICPTLLVKVFADMKSCEQIWLVSGPAEIYQDTFHFRLKGNV
jgi:hypothetical protein